MPRLALTAAVLTAVLAGCAGSARTPVALVATADPLATAQPVETVPTTAPPPPTTDPAAARLAAARAEAARASRSARRTAAPAVARPAISGDVWGALARCESGGNPRAVGGGGRYFGAFQFSLGTWHSLGYSGNPIDYDYGTQLAAAQRLVARGGWGQFPHCSRSIGAR
jgi:hypothetical protein